MSPSAQSRRRLWLTLGGIGVALLAAAVFTIGSLNPPLRPQRGTEFIPFFALTTFNAVAFIVFGLVLVRSLVRLWAERRAGQLGARFKTKMVLGAIAVSLLPVIFLFFISYALMNRTLSKWFPRPLELATEESRNLIGEMGVAEHERLDRIAAALAASGASPLPLSADASWVVSAGGAVGDIQFGPAAAPAHSTPSASPAAPRLLQTLTTGAEIWKVGGNLFLTGKAPLAGAKTLYVARRVPDDYLERRGRIETQADTYYQQRENLRAYKSEILLVLLLFTLLILFSTTWVALFLSKSVTVPIQAMAEGTQQVALGNFAFRVNVQAQDELGTLVNSFNQMTAQLGASRRQIEDFTRSLQHAIDELDRRRKLLETILENVPAGVLSLDADARIVRINSAVTRLFGQRAASARTLEELVGSESAAALEQLVRQAQRMHTASRALELEIAGRRVHTAVTVSSLGQRRSDPGYVVVFDDLTDLLRAQKAAAWQEVAQRIAHEIKNPLTPIQLSFERLARALGRSPSKAPGELERLVGECAPLVEREIATLKSLVDEFSQFARFPAAHLVPANVNEIVAGALEVFHGRLDNIRVDLRLADSLPPVRADADLLRRVIVNLIDNAAEAMEGSQLRLLEIRTRFDEERDTVEISVADTGPGISPEDKDRLFLPHFSTKDRGTGLGLAIANRIIAEHAGTLRVEDHLPSGARFLIRLPVAEVAAAQPGTPG